MLNWTPPVDWLTQLKTVVGDIFSSFWGILAVIIGFTLVADFLLEIILSAVFPRHQDQEVGPTMSDIVESHLHELRKKKLEKEYEAFGISEMLEQKIEREAALEAEHYRERVAKRWKPARQRSAAERYFDAM